VTQRICMISGCGRDLNCKGLCKAHYGRLLTHGGPLAHIPLRHLPIRSERSDVVARILARCVANVNGCIEWTGTKSQGYGNIRWQGRDWRTHRAIWTATVGPIPSDDDWTIDHLCRNRACQNVEHMEIVTRTENTRRGGGLPKAQANNITRPTCKNGHQYPDGYVPRDARGYRYCKQCRADTWSRQAAHRNAIRRATYLANRQAGIHWTQARLARGQQHEAEQCQP
jgi:hypothetical protein